MAQQRTIHFTYASLIVMVFIILSYIWYSLYGQNENVGVASPSQTSASEHSKMDQLRLAIDQKYCGGRCRFLLPVYIAEQESKAQLHVRQLAFMSGLLNRTYVLPNMDDSRLGACQKNNFSIYYSEDWVKNNTGFFSAITVTDFTNWLEERLAIHAPATSQNMFIHMSQEQSRSFGLKKNCFEGLMAMGNVSMRNLYLNEDFHTGLTSDLYETIIREFLSGEEIDLDGETDAYTDDDAIDMKAYVEGLDVLSVFYDRRSAIIQNPAANVPIPFNPKIAEVVDTIANHITPYWAIHWRMETIYPAERLLHCAYSLVTLVKDLVAKSNLTELPTVFLLTDYPHVFNEQVINKGIKEGKNGKELGLKPTSATFYPKILVADHHRAIQHVYKNLQVQVTATEDEDLTGIPANWQVIPISNDVTGGDPGMLGMIDKMLAIKAQVFIAGQQGVCARASSYTRRIVHERQDRRRKEGNLPEVKAQWNDWGNKDPGMMKNIVDYFKYPKDYHP